jgi:hypothetical protein
MMRSFLWWQWTAMMVLVCCAAWAAQSPEVTGKAANDLVRQGDAAFALRDDPAQLKVALHYYELALGAQTPTTDAAWKASRAAYWIADLSPKRADKLEYFQKGMDCAKAAIATDPNSVEGHYWLGGNEGSYGDAVAC